MITTAVQVPQASQMVEIQGAPPSPQTGEAFHAIFSASVDGAGKEEPAREEKKSTSRQQGTNEGTDFGRQVKPGAETRKGTLAAPAKGVALRAETIAEPAPLKDEPIAGQAIANESPTEDEPQIAPRSLQHAMVADEVGLPEIGVAVVAKSVATLRAPRALVGAEVLSKPVETTTETGKTVFQARKAEVHATKDAMPKVAAVDGPGQTMTLPTVAALQGIAAVGSGSARAEVIAATSIRQTSALGSGLSRDAGAAAPSGNFTASVAAPAVEPVSVPVDGASSKGGHVATNEDRSTSEGSGSVAGTAAPAIADLPIEANSRVAGDGGPTATTLKDPKLAAVANDSPSQAAAKVAGSKGVVQSNPLQVKSIEALAVPPAPAARRMEVANPNRVAPVAPRGTEAAATEVSEQQPAVDGKRDVAASANLTRPGETQAGDRPTPQTVDRGHADTQADRAGNSGRENAPVPVAAEIGNGATNRPAEDSTTAGVSPQTAAVPVAAVAASTATSTAPERMPGTVAPGPAGSVTATAPLGGVAMAVPVAAGPSGGGASAMAARIGGLDTSVAGAPPVLEPHRTLLATPTTLEVGVPNGTQGWLRIRAEVGGQGEVTASLTAGSSGAQELLHSQLPALNAYLHSEQMAVTTTISDRNSGAAVGHGGVTPDANGSGRPDGAASFDGQAQAGDQREGGGSDRVARSESGIVGRDAVFATATQAVAPLLMADENGRWLNVRA